LKAATKKVKKDAEAARLEMSKAATELEVIKNKLFESEREAEEAKKANDRVESELATMKNGKCWFTRS
jgi:hypothetical protein